MQTFQQTVTFSELMQYVARSVDICCKKSAYDHSHSAPRKACTRRQYAIYNLRMFDLLLYNLEAVVDVFV